MDEQKTASPPANIGISLLLSVFLVLCLFTFSAIALVQAENEWHQATMTRDNRTAYYKAASQAEEELCGLNSGLRSGEMPKQKTIERQYALSDTQALSVVFTYRSKENAYRFSEFRTIATKTWEGDDSLNVIR